MARSLNENDTTFFRLKKEHTEKNWGPHYEGPYSTKGATKARMSWNRGYNFFTIQQLVAKSTRSAPSEIDENGTLVEHLDGVLVWVDIESYRSA